MLKLAAFAIVLPSSEKPISMDTYSSPFMIKLPSWPRSAVLSIEKFLINKTEPKINTTTNKLKLIILRLFFITKPRFNFDVRNIYRLKDSYYGIILIVIITKGDQSVRFLLKGFLWFKVTFFMLQMNILLHGYCKSFFMNCQVQLFLLFL